MSKFLRGHYLIAAKRLRDANFFRTVVLLIEHSDEGAMGLVVNRPSSVTVGHALSEHFKLPATDDLVFVGGPVEPSALFILHNSIKLDHAEHSIVPGVYVGSSPEVFESVVRKSAAGDVDLKFRIFSGYAGWGANQLEGEIARGDWYAIPATACALFDADPYDVWDLQLKKYNDASGVLPPCHQNPEWN